MALPRSSHAAAAFDETHSLVCFSYATRAPGTAAKVRAHVADAAAGLARARGRRLRRACTTVATTVVLCVCGRGGAGGVCFRFAMTTLTRLCNAFVVCVVRALFLHGRVSLFYYQTQCAALARNQGKLTTGPVHELVPLESSTGDTLMPRAMAVASTGTHAAVVYVCVDAWMRLMFSWTRSYFLAHTRAHTHTHTSSSPPPPPPQRSLSRAPRPALPALGWPPFVFLFLVVSAARVRVCCTGTRVPRDRPFLTVRHTVGATGAGAASQPCPATAKSARSRATP